MPPQLAENKLSFQEAIDAAVGETMVWLLGENVLRIAIVLRYLRDERGTAKDTVAQQLGMLFLTLG